MNIKNLKISIQLRVGFAILLLFVIVLGVVGYMQSNKIHQQTESMYNHPLKTRRAIELITSNVLNMRMNIRDFLLVEDAKARQNVLNEIAVNQSNVQSKTEDLKDSYLGPRQDIDDFTREFTKWVSIRQETVRWLLPANSKRHENAMFPAELAPTQATNVLNALEKISDFALRKGDELYANSVKLTDSLNNRLFTLIAIILLLSIIINYILLRNIRKPLEELTSVTRKFQKGNLDARSSYTSKNEFGVLSGSFNSLAESIQDKTEIDEKFATLAALMLSEYDIKKFFQSTLNVLAEHTSSQMAAIYLLSDDKKTFNHYESIGIDDNARQSFAAESFEGEFGAVISTRKVQHIRNITEDTRFIFHTVNGKFIPREIITLPIIADNQVVAIVSLASVNMYSQQSFRLIDRILVTLSARVEGILAFYKIKEFSEKLEHQNRELEAQKTELASQSAELTEQNTELEMQKKQLGEASRLKTNFLSNMSHELRTPLNSVIALSGVLNRRLADKIPEEEYSYLEVIERNGKHLLELINDILDISRIESGKEEYELTRFGVNSLISEVITMINPQANQKNIELLYSAANPDIQITSDNGKIRHILQNIVGNAVKFTEKGKVEVKAMQKEKNIEISVSDTGIGISEDQISHIFDEFRQADGSTSRRFGGTGLGLAIAKKYANLLGGKISVKSTQGKGSTFTLTIPENYIAGRQIDDSAISSLSKYAIKPSIQQPKSDSARKTILLVDDSEPAIIQLKDILGEYDYSIFTARNGFEALEIIGHTIPDAMILDLMMPGIDGFEVLKTLRDAEATALVPVLILTAKQITKEELSFLKRNNIHQLIQKGDVRRDELLNAVSKMLFPATKETIKSQQEKQIIDGKPVVLVVEDNPDNMTTVKAILADKYLVIEAEDGKESIALAMKHKPNLILMDIALPVMDGIEAFQTIRNDVELKHIPVIALTASAMVSDREAILAYGFDGYIAKPINDKEFFKTINEILYGK